jgi:hypothetical protein
VRRFFLLAAVAAIPCSAALADSAFALSHAQCSRYIRIYGNTTVPALARTATRCLLSRARTNARLHGLKVDAALSLTAGRHAQESVAAPYWDPARGQVSHLDPGWPVPSDPAELQTLALDFIDNRIRSDGYCLGSKSYADTELTYSASGTGQTPNAAAHFWLTDPAQRQAVMDPRWNDYGVGVVRGSAYPGGSSNSATFVVELGTCTK